MVCASVHEKEGVDGMTCEEWEKEKQEYEEMMERDKSWFFALSRDLQTKSKEFDAMKEELEKAKRENGLLLDKLAKKDEEMKRLMEKVSVPVVMRLSRDGKQTRAYCGVCGHYANRAHTFCYRCGTLYKRG